MSSNLLLTAQLCRQAYVVAYVFSASRCSHLFQHNFKEETMYAALVSLRFRCPLFLWVTAWILFSYSSSLPLGTNITQSLLNIGTDNGQCFLFDYFNTRKWTLIPTFPHFCSFDLHIDKFSFFLILWPRNLVFQNYYWLIRLDQDSPSQLKAACWTFDGAASQSATVLVQATTAAWLATASSIYASSSAN